MQRVVEVLSGIVADEFVLYAKTHNTIDER